MRWSVGIEDSKQKFYFSILYVLVALGVALSFAAYTGRMREDYLIALRYSRNLVEGHGLVYNPGQFVQGFTSPINIFTNALFYMISPEGAPESVLFYSTILQSLFLAFAGALVVRHLLNLRGSAWLVALIFSTVFVFQVKPVDYSVNGQERASGYSV